MNGHQGSGIAYLFFVEERNLEVPSDLRDETEAKAVELIFVRRRRVKRKRLYNEVNQLI